MERIETGSLVLVREAGKPILWIEVIGTVTYSGAEDRYLGRRLPMFGSRTLRHFDLSEVVAIIPPSVVTEEVAA